jgi:hypothetical protein
MAKKEGGLLASLGKRILGFSSSSSGCCAMPDGVDSATSPKAGASESAVVIKTPEAPGRDDAKS